MQTRGVRPLLALMAVAVAATGCTTLDPYTREEQTSAATRGALLGAGVGAVVGLLSGDDAVERTLPELAADDLYLPSSSRSAACLFRLASLLSLLD